MTTTASKTCPARCTNHDALSDGRDHWHKSWGVEVAGFIFLRLDRDLHRGHRDLHAGIARLRSGDDRRRR
jgi:hypothetical protein